jgi:hypothetical protein
LIGYGNMTSVRVPRTQVSLFGVRSIPIFGYLAELPLFGDTIIFI